MNCLKLKAVALYKHTYAKTKPDFYIKEQKVKQGGDKK